MNWSGLQDSNLRGHCAVCLEGSCHRPLGQARMKRDTPRRMRIASGTDVPRPSPGRRRDARANDNLLAALLHGGPVFGIRIVKELHLSVRCRARWRCSKTKSPVGYAHSPGLVQCLRGLALRSSTPARCARAIRLRLAEMQARQSKSGHRVDARPDAIRPPA